MVAKRDQGKKKKIGDEDLPSTRAQAREIMDGKYMTIFMAAVTLFALFGDDMRLWFTDKAADPIFFALLIFSIICFTAEILVNSCVIDDPPYKYQFFFWLDIIATISIVPDVEWLVTPLQGMVGMKPDVYTSDVYPGELAVMTSQADKITKIVKSLRLIRLIRIIKLYKYLVKSKADLEEQRLKEQQKLSKNVQQAALNKELEPGNIGRTLSDALTRRLIILVLLLLMVLPAITYTAIDVSQQYGLKTLFWFGRSNCYKVGGDIQMECEPGKLWTSQAGWEEHLRQFVSSSRPSEEQEPNKDVLWIYVPDYSDNGRITSIQNITNWQSDNQEFFDALEVLRESFPTNQTWQWATRSQKCQQIVEGPDGAERLSEPVDDEQSETIRTSDAYTLSGKQEFDSNECNVYSKDAGSEGEVGEKYCCHKTQFTQQVKSAWFQISEHPELIASLEIDDEEFMDLITIKPDINPVQQINNFTYESVVAFQSLKRNMFPGELYWRQYDKCAGFIVSGPGCDLRWNEMKLLMYTPSHCLEQPSNLTFSCKTLVAYSRVSIKPQNINMAALQFGTTIFTCFVLATGSIMFASDTQKIIITPITKMVGIIKTLADEPLDKPAPPVFDENELQMKDQNQMKTVELQKTIFRIGNLLQMSFGQLGAMIIKQQLSSGDGNLEIMIPGVRASVIFMVVRINNFVDYSDSLKAHITDFLNRVVYIMHHSADRWGGQANKSDGNKFLITWQLPDVENNQDHEKTESLMIERTEVADKSLIAAVKIVSEIRRSQQFAVYFRKSAMRQRFGPDVKHPYLTFALHMGWTVQGAIGSDNKIDASYLSPNLQIAYRLEELTQFYDMQILLSEPLYNLMSLKARNTLRKIDVISLNMYNNQGQNSQNNEPIGIYTFDLSFNNKEVVNISEDHKIGDLIKLAEYETINIEAFQNKGVDYMFTLDSDIVGLQHHIHEFNPIFRQAFKCYIQGEWQIAYENIERCLELWDNDGPTKSIQLYMSYYQYQAPETWTGHRNLDEDINQEEIMRQMGMDGQEAENANQN